MNNTDKYSLVSGFEFAGSDHKLIYVVRKKCKTLSNSENLKEYRSYKNFDVEKFNSELLKINWEVLKLTDNDDDALVIFDSIVLALLSLYAPMKKKLVSKKLAPWFNSEISELCIRRDKVKKQFNSKREPEIFIQYKKLRNDVNSKLLAAKKEYFRKKLDKYRDSENIWKVMNELLNYKSKSSTKVCKLVDNEGNVLDDNDSVCSKFADEFIVKSSVSETIHLKKDIDDYVKLFLNENPDYMKFPFFDTEILAAVHYVKKGNSAGSIPMRVMKACIETLVTCACWNNITQQWKYSLIPTKKFLLHFLTISILLLQVSTVISTFSALSTPMLQGLIYILKYLEQMDITCSNTKLSL